MNLGRSINNFEKRLNRVDPIVGTKNKTGTSSLKGRQIIPLIKIFEFAAEVAEVIVINSKFYSFIFL